MNSIETDRTFWRSNAAIVDLSNEITKITITPEKVVKALLGGRGVNMYYLQEFLKPSIDPLSPENPLIIGTGLLTGTGAPNCSRMNITTKSPETGILGDTNIGGFFPAEMRYAGLDRLVIHGKAEDPSYLLLKDGKVEIRNATTYWGLDTLETQLNLRKELGTHIEVLCIGPAGENRVRYATVINGVKNAAGRCGIGAVMGSKNIKAIVASGTQGIPIHSPKEFIARVAEINDYLGQSKIVQTLGRVGTPLLYEVSNFLGAIRTKNSQLNAFEDTLDAEEIHKFVEKMLSCHGCPVHCRHRNILGGEGPEYTTIGLLGANLGIADTKEVIELNNLANRLGLDVSSTGTIIAWSFELYERGLIDEALTNGIQLEFGNIELVKQLMMDISAREGFGDILAESGQATKIFGEEAKDYLIAIKGLPQSDPHDCRYIKSFALGIATSSRGADHLRSRPTLDILDLPPEIYERLYGVSISPSPIVYETKEHIVYGQENIHAVIDSLGLCKFVCRGFNSPRLLGYDHFAELIRLVTGLEYPEENLQEIGKRIVELERRINVCLGVSRKDDTLPKRYFDDPMPLNLAKGHHIDRDEFQKLLSRYYLLRGWDDEGRPTSTDALW